MRPQSTPLVIVSETGGVGEAVAPARRVVSYSPRVIWAALTITESGSLREYAEAKRSNVNVQWMVLDKEPRVWQSNARR